METDFILIFITSLLSLGFFKKMFSWELSWVLTIAFMLSVFGQVPTLWDAGIEGLITILAQELPKLVCLIPALGLAGIISLLINSS